MKTFWISFFCVLILNQFSFSQESVPVFGNPPKLELHFKDTFTEFDRKAYRPRGDVDSIKNGIRISSGSFVRKKMDKGYRLRLMLETVFPDESGDLRIIATNGRGTNSELRIRKRENGFDICLSGKDDATSPTVKPIEAGDGKYRIEYCYGLWTIEYGNQKQFLFQEGAFQIRELRVGALGGEIQLQSIECWQVIQKKITDQTVDLMLEVAEESRAISAKFRRRDPNALPAADQLLKRCRQLGRYCLESAEALGTVAVVYYKSGRSDGVQELFDELLEARSKVVGTSHPLYANGLGEYAVFLDAQGADNLALENYQNAISILSRTLGRKHQFSLFTMNNLANKYMELGRYHQAFPMFELVKSEFGKNVKAPGVRAIYATVTSNLAVLYTNIGQFNKALELFREAASIREQLYGKHSAPHLSVLQNMASAYRSQGQLAKALEINELLTPILQRSSRKTKFHFSHLDNRGILAQQTGDLEGAERFFNLAHEIIVDLEKNSVDHAILLNNLGILHLKAGKYKKAQQTFQNSSRIISSISETNAIHSNGLFHNAIADYFLEDNQAALEKLKKGLGIYQELVKRMGTIQSTNQQRNYLKSVHDLVDLYISINREQSATVDYDMILDLKGLNLLWQKRFQELAEQGETAGIFKQLETTSHELIHHTNQRSSNPSWIERLKQLNRRKEDLEQKLAQMNPGFKDQLKIWTTAKLAAMLPQDCAFVDFVRINMRSQHKTQAGFLLSEPRLVAFVINPGEKEAKFVDIANIEELENKVSNWREFIDGKSVDESKFDQAAQYLRNTIWLPVKEHIGNATTVLISPDGPLGRVPMVALPGATRGSYLLEKYKIAYVPVPRLLPEILGRQRSVQPQRKRFLLIGNVDYDANMSKQTSGLTQTKLQTDRFLERTKWKSLKFAELPGSKVEINTLRRYLASFEPLMLDRKNATRQTLQQLMPTYDVIHIASHGFVRLPQQEPARTSITSATDSPTMQNIVSENPDLLSGIALAGANRFGHPDHDGGILFSAEIALMQLKNCELVVLSACDTSLGSNIKGLGEGLGSVQRGFQVAGAETTIASYWRVNDRTTQLLMNEFYKRLFADPSINSTQNGVKPISKLDALRDAQLWMLNNKVIASATHRGDPIEVDPKKIRAAPAPVASQNNRTHPRFWAAFMLSGDWR